MSYSFDASLSEDKDLVRFHIGDTSSAGYYLEDETIQYWVDDGSVGSAVVACIKYIITQLSSPDFKQDWMSVSNKEARAGFENLLKVKSQEFGISSGATATATISLPYRADSHQYTSDTRQASTSNETGIYDGTP